MGFLNGIEYHELDGSNRLAYSPDGIVGTRLFQVDWDDRIAFAQALLGYTNAVGDLPIRTDAQTFPGYDRLYCRNATVLGHGLLDEGGGGQVASYDLARITAEYRPWSYSSSNVEDDDYDEDLEANMARWEEVHEYGADVLSIPGSKFFWTAPPLGVAVDTPVGLFIPVTDYTFTSAAEPELRRAAIRSATGKVNDDTWLGAPAGYILFTAASARRTATSQGVSAWEITYRFREKTHSWNEFYGRAGGVERWEAIEDEHGNPPYASADFDILFV